MSKQIAAATRPNEAWNTGISLSAPRSGSPGTGLAL